MDFSEEPKEIDESRTSSEEMNRFGEWDTDARIFKAMGEQRVFCESVEHGDLAALREAGDLGDVGDFEKPQSHKYVARISTYPGRGDGGIRYSTLKYRARGDVAALLVAATATLMTNGRMPTKEEVVEFRTMLAEEEPSTFKDFNSFADYVKYNNEEAGIEYLKDETGRVIYSDETEEENEEEDDENEFSESAPRIHEVSFYPPCPSCGTPTLERKDGEIYCTKCHGVFSKEEVQATLHENSKVVAVADSLKGVIDIFFPELKDEYTRALETGDTNALKMFIHEIDNEVLSAPQDFSEEAVRVCKRIHECFRHS